MLTVAVPTFNRADILKKNIAKLLPQLNDQCRLLIFDNCSSVAVEPQLRDVLEPYSHLDVQVIRNRYNVGMTANILKCFEACNDPWLWVLGDDDEVSDDAISTIFRDINTHSDVYAITYAWDADSLKRPNEVITVGVEEFIEKFETFGAVLYLSTSVYNVSLVSKSMSLAHFFQTSYAPHLIFILMSLGERGRCLYSHNQIVTNKGDETPAELKWDQIFIYQITLLLRLPLPPIVIAKLKIRLAQLTRVWSVGHFIYKLTFDEKNSIKNGRPIILYDEVVRNFYHLDRRVSSRILIKVGYFIIRYPGLFHRPLSIIYKMLKGHEFKESNNKRV